MRYLSEEWIGAADKAMNEAAPPAIDSPLVIDQFVNGAVNYRITVSDTGASIQIIDSAANSTEADARFEQTLQTATAVAQGSTDAHQAFLLGHIRFSGDVGVLIERRDAFAWIESALAPVLAATTFGDG